jgi:LysR family transcriptional regulator, low CO2-responsive transcriptional regulator
VTQLTAFLAVVRGGSVTAAADELVVTQPSVSSAVAALSRELGCELFERSGRGIRLTDAGAAFRPYATDIVGLLEEGRQAAREAAALAARAGLGVSLLPRAAVEPELASGWLGEITLADGPEPRPWFVLRSSVGPARAPAATFAEFVRVQSRALSIA